MPAPSAEASKYVERFIDPQYTLDLIQDRVRLIKLKKTPRSRLARR